jgi:hypothetical protein
MTQVLFATVVRMYIAGMTQASRKGSRDFLAALILRGPYRKQPV